MPGLSRRTQAALAVALLIVAIAGASWTVATGRLTPGTLTLRALACLGALTLAGWLRDLARSIRRR
ncbi:hypothetical protein ACWGCW_00920 [Streptomyces sp. NPDC054933]